MMRFSGSPPLDARGGRAGVVAVKTRHPIGPWVTGGQLSFVLTQTLTLEMAARLVSRNYL